MSAKVGNGRRVKPAELWANILAVFDLPSDTRFDYIFLRIGTNDLTAFQRNSQLRRDYPSVESYFSALLKWIGDLAFVANAKRRFTYVGAGYFRTELAGV